MPNPVKRVAIHITNGPAYYAEVFVGISTYTRGHHRWRITSFPTIAVATNEEVEAELVAQRPHGAIGMGSGFWEEQVASKPIQFVDIEHKIAVLPSLPRVGLDEAEIGRLAAGHFRERGYTQLATVTASNTLPAVERIAAFVEAAGEWCESPVAQYDLATGSEDFESWLAALPRPVAVFGWNDETGRLIHQCCVDLDRRIPDDVAILGVDNDEAVCETLEPTLSSVDGNAQRVGYEAAALLDRLMEGEPPPDGPILVPPVGVVTRGSTDQVAVGPPKLVEAVRYIREHATHGLLVEDVLAHLDVSRSTLEKQFRKTLGRSPRSEIYRVLIEHARDLLAHTDLRIPIVAERCGYPSANHFSTMFRKQTGETPTAYRSRVRLTG